MHISIEIRRLSCFWTPRCPFQQVTSHCFRSHALVAPRLCDALIDQDFGACIAAAWRLIRNLDAVAEPMKSCWKCSPSVLR